MTTNFDHTHNVSIRRHRILSLFPHYGVATAVIQLAELILANNEDSG